MSASRYVSTALFAALILQTSVRAQQRGSSSGQTPIHLYWPSTVEYRIHEHHQDRPEADRDYVLVMANDSQGRVLWRYKFADGQSSLHVFDPVAAEEIWWNTGTKAKVVKYPTPVADRFSCWRRAWSERSSSTGRPVGYDFRTTCAPAGPPAGQGQYPNCRDTLYTERLAKALPPEKKGFPKCDAAPEGTAEDLGTSVIQGIEAHGCRRTTPSPKEGNVLTENWFDEYGLSLREIQEHPNGDRFRWELISLTREEPDLSMFQPPNGYEVVTLEMEEVPCEASPQSLIVSMPLSSPTGHR